MPQPNQSDGKSKPDTKAHIKIKIISKNSFNSTHTLVPAGQDSFMVQHRVGNDGNKKPHKSANHSPKRKHHAKKDQAQVKLNPCCYCRKDSFGMPCQLNPGDGNQSDGFGKNKTRNCRNEDINRSKRKPDYTANGKDPPFPAFLPFLLGFRQGNRSQCTHRCHGKGQFFNIRSNPKQCIPQTKLIHSLDDL